MALRQKPNLEVVSIKTNNNFASVTCKIHNCMAKAAIGESINTEPFDLTVGGFATKWIIFFYPNGQYDFGVASKDYRVYVKLVACGNAAVKTMKVNMETTLMSTLSRSVSHDNGVCAFTVVDNRSSWAGPFHLQHDDKDTLTGNLIVDWIFQENSKPIDQPKRLKFSPEIDEEIRKYERMFKG